MNRRVSLRLEGHPLSVHRLWVASVRQNRLTIMGAQRESELLPTPDGWIYFRNPIAARQALDAAARGLRDALGAPVDEQIRRGARS